MAGLWLLWFFLPVVGAVLGPARAFADLLALYFSDLYRPDDLVALGFWWRLIWSGC